MNLVSAVVDEGLGNSSYLVDLGDGRALVIDPSRHPGPYLERAEKRGLTVAFTAETHLHADFVSGSRELAALGARVLAPAAAALEFPAAGLADGDTLDLGGLTLEAQATPGHTPEHLSYLLRDGRRPLALFSGGSLLVGGVARTDLISGAQTEDLARRLWHSLQSRILSLPDDLPVYPTHGAGSFCSAPAGADRVTSIGAERRSNPWLAVGGEDEFVDRLLAGSGSYPPYFLRLRDVNRRGPHVFGPGPPALPELTPQEVTHVRELGGWVVDVRPVGEFALAHLDGSVSISLRDAFATWLGWLVPPDVPLVFVVDREQDRDRLVREARKVGYEQLAGEVAGGIGDWISSGGPVSSFELAPAGEADGVIVDVRQRSEFDAGHVPGAVNVELGSVATAPLPDCHLSVMCAHGERAMSAASVLARRGRLDLRVLAGGAADWAAAHEARLATA